MNTALTIAGSDSSGGAGIQADIKTFAANGVNGVSVVTAVTAQNTIGVTAVHAIPVDVVTAQIEAVVADFSVDATKTGMLANQEIVEAVVTCIRNMAMTRVVVDPVIISTSGTRLLEESAFEILRTKLLPSAFCVTPNRAEAEMLADCSIESISDARDAARCIVDLGVEAVVITGGHLPTEDVIEVLFDGSNFVEFSGPRLDCSTMHGTGCAFSAAMTAALASGRTLVDSVDAAKSYVLRAIRRGVPVGSRSDVLTHL